MALDLRGGWKLRWDTYSFCKGTAENRVVLAPGWRSCTFVGMARALEKFRLALLASLSHDVFGNAKGAAYSAILCLFPTILVLTTLLALTPESDTLRGEMRAAFADVLPADTMNLLYTYVTTQKVRGEQVVFSAIVVSLVAAMGVMNSLMEGFRRAY